MIERCVFVGGALEPLAAGSAEFKPVDEASEGAGTMMILAMDVVGNRAAHGNELGAGGHRQKPASGHEDAQYFTEQRARLAAQSACFVIEGHEVVEAPR